MVIDRVGEFTSSIKTVCVPFDAVSDLRIIPPGYSVASAIVSCCTVHPLGYQNEKPKSESVYLLMPETRPLFGPSWTPGRQPIVSHVCVTVMDAAPITGYGPPVPFPSVVSVNVAVYVPAVV